MAIKVGNKSVSAVLRGGVDVSKILLDGIDLGAGPIAPPGPVIFRTVGTRGEPYNIEAAATTSANVKNLARYRQYIGARCDVIKPIFVGYWLDAPGEVAAANAYKIRGAYTAKNGNVVQVKFGLQVTGEVAPGLYKYEGDELWAEQFGLPYFDQADIMWSKFIREVNVGEKHLYKTAAAYPTPIAGESFMVGAANAPEHQLLTPGALVAGNGWTVAAHTWFAQGLVGRKLTRRPSIGISGASLEDGFNDDAGDGYNGYGGALRQVMAYYDLPRMHVAKGGETMLVWNNNGARRLQLLKEFNEYLIFGQVGNDYTQGATAAQAKTRIELAHTNAKGGAVEQTFQMEAVIKANKVNSSLPWTAANQVPRSNFEVGGTWRVGLNNDLRSAAAWGANIAAVISTAISDADPTKQDVWKDYYTDDGTHRTPAGHKAAAEGPLRTWFGVLLPAYLANTVPALPTFWPLPEPAPAAPTQKVAPVISGNPRVGTALAATRGEANGRPTPTVDAGRWYLDGVAVTGATGQSFTPVEADIGKIPSYREVWTNSQGSVTLVSNELAAITAAPTGGYAPESELVFAQRSDLSTPKKQAIDDFIKALIAADVYSRMDVIQFYRVGLFNWKDSTKFLATLGAGASRTDAAGIITTATAGAFAQTGYNPSLAGMKMQQNSASVLFGIAAGGGVSTSSVAGFHDGTKGISIAPHTGTNMTFRINSATAKQTAQQAPNGGNGTFSLNRSDAGISDAYSNGVHNGNFTDVFSGAISNGEIRLGSISGTTSVPRTFDAFMAGSSLTLAQHNAMHTALANFRTAYANAA